MWPLPATGTFPHSFKQLEHYTFYGLVATIPKEVPILGAERPDPYWSVNLSAIGALLPSTPWLNLQHSSSSRLASYISSIIRKWDEFLCTVLYVVGELQSYWVGRLPVGIQELETDDITTGRRLWSLSENSFAASGTGAVVAHRCVMAEVILPAMLRKFRWGLVE